MISTLRFDELHLPCPCGRSSDAFCKNSDGSGKCFSCNKFFKRSNKQKSRWIEVEDLTEGNYSYSTINWRGVYSHTFDFFNVKFKINNETKTAVEVGFPYPNESVKVRYLDRKDFFTTGDAKNATLFGMNLFDPGALKTITIFEGELDAISGFQMLGKGTSACVSIRASAAAKTDCSRQDVWTYINSFDKIVLCLDNDEVGNRAARAIASLFDFNKVFKVDLSRHKDANAYLEAKEQDEFVKAWYGAKRFTPDNVISTFHEIEESLKESSEDMIATYPFTGLQNALYGLHRGEVIVFKGDEGIGKQLANDTMIPTPTGWTTMGHLKVGDTIIGADGEPTKVTFVTEDQFVDCYKVTFNDQTSVIAGGPHRWGVLNQNNKYFVKTTEEILNEGVIASNNASRYSVPIMKPFVGKRAKFSVNPYLLGIWLGDGHSYSANISVGLDKLEEFTNSIVNRGYTIQKVIKYKTCYSVQIKELTHKALHDLGVLVNKHIPDIYLRANITQRRELLKGLMDTDGGVHQTSCEFYTSSDVLKEQVVELIRSLGYAARIRTKQSKLYGVPKKIAYTIRFMAENGYDVFSYKSKAEKVSVAEKTRLTKKAIISIEKVNTVPSRCITVDNPDHLYVCDTGWTVTHNTETFRAMEHHILKTVPDSRIGIIHLEEDEGTTVKGLATYEDKYPYVHPEYEVEPKQIMEAFKKAVDQKEDRVYIYESFDVEDENQMLDTIRFLVSACGCDFIFLDHITWLATGMENEDERKKLDRISQKLKLLAKELRFCLIMISHTNDDGKTRGSRNISKVANTVIHLTRDKVSPSLEERNKMYYTIEKARTGGNTGPAGIGIFDRETMMLIDGNQVFEQVDVKEAMRA